MYDGGKIVPGLILFLAVLVSPFWYNAATGQAASGPEVVKPLRSHQCIEATEYMKANHMQLLIRWREDVVRNGDRSYLASDGQGYEKSLTGNCLDSRCHGNRAEFCDRCHDYSHVQPNCWSCHTAPEEGRA